MGLTTCKECGASISTKAPTCPQCGAKRHVGACGCLLGALSLPFLVVIVVMVLDDSPKPKRTTTTADRVQQPVAHDSPDPISYTVVEREDVSYAATPRMVVRIRLDMDSPPPEERMVETARQIWDAERNRWKEFNVFMIFGEIEDFSSGAYGIAEFTPAGLKEFRISYTPLRMLELKRSGALDNLEE